MQTIAPSGADAHVGECRITRASLLCRRIHGLWIAFFLLLALLPGCKKKEASVPPSTQTAHSRQPLNQILIAGQETPFPPTLIVLLDRDPLTLEIHTDGSATETGNELKLTLTPPVSNLDELDGVEFDIKIPGAQWTDSLEGFILSDGKQILQPSDVRTLLFHQDNWMRIELVGDFLAFDDGSQTPRPDKIKVMALWEGNLNLPD